MHKRPLLPRLAVLNDVDPVPSGARTAGLPCGRVSTDISVRDATAADAAACAAIYSFWIRETAASFETDPPTPAQMADRIEAAVRTHAWLVLVDAETGTGAAEAPVIGYAYGGPFRSRPAYRWTCEVSVYLARERHRRGGGRLIYTALLDRLADRGYRTAVAGMTLPNQGSVALHRATGFRPVGTYHRVGYKNGEWHDVAWVERSLGPVDDAPDEPG